jgi:hypothetical protein
MRFCSEASCVGEMTLQRCEDNNVGESSSLCPCLVIFLFHTVCLGVHALGRQPPYCTRGLPGMLHV